MNLITIQSINHKDHRYLTVGDWYTNDTKLGPMDIIRVSKMEDERHEFLVAFHELIESRLCKLRKINQAVVDNFDTVYEANRREEDNSEPGDSPDAPYYKEHQFATALERLLACEMGVDWNEYEKAINALQ